MRTLPANDPLFVAEFVPALAQLVDRAREAGEDHLAPAAGRPAAAASPAFDRGWTIASVLLPDMLIIQTNKPGNTAGWLTWALADGYGGRKLTDDVVDAGQCELAGRLQTGDGESV